MGALKAIIPAQLLNQMIKFWVDLFLQNLSDYNFSKLSFPLEINKP